MQRILQEIMKKRYLEHQTLGRRVICPSKPAYYIVDCRISGLFKSMGKLDHHPLETVLDYPTRPCFFHYTMYFCLHRPTTTNTPSTCKVTIHSVSKALISLRVVCQAVAIQAKQASLNLLACS